MFEPKSGGSWRYVQKDQEGNEYAFHGVNHEVTAPERIISTFEFEGLPEKGHVILDTARFEALPGNRTELISQSVFQKVEDHDGMLQSGMEEGVNDSCDQLDELLERMQKTGLPPK
nr:SRPBCC domain-containing protein [Methanosarcina horonobensis]